MGNSVFDGKIEGRPVRPVCPPETIFSSIGLPFLVLGLDLLKLCENPHEKPLPA